MWRKGRRIKCEPDEGFGGDSVLSVGKGNSETFMETRKKIEGIQIV